ncbi:MAG: c-type cytochrome biogenesis protein CcmI [Pseudomonadota bacterium]|nr:c-type cytochrome biogenesis protein CcmI [Pseudomonadota bacterium]
MLLFWILAAVMVSLALAFVLPPLLKNKPESASVDQNSLNVAVVRQQLQELKADLANGKLSAGDFEAARTDLEKELLNDIDDSATGTARGARATGPWAALLVGLLIPLTAIPLYRYLGAGDLVPALQSATRGEDQPPPGGERLPSVDEMVANLEARVQSEPENPEGWQMLGRSYMVLNRYKKATAAFEHANGLAEGRNPSLLASYAEAMSLAAGGTLEGRPAELVGAALAIEPDNPKALWLDGYVKYQAGDFPGAIAQWGKVAQMVPPGSEQSVSILEAIRLAQEHMGEPVATAATDTSAGPSNSAGASEVIRARISLEAHLLNQVSPGDTVFILARALNGPRMPLAIVRKTVSDLPATVELDDSTAMSPATALSGFSEVAIEARVSKSGQAMAQSGDLSGRVAPISPGTEAVVDLTIDTVVP